jgi:hypothetical protein
LLIASNGRGQSRSSPQINVGHAWTRTIGNGTSLTARRAASTASTQSPAGTAPQSTFAPTVSAAGDGRGSGDRAAVDVVGGTLDVTLDRSNGVLSRDAIDAPIPAPTTSAPTTIHIAIARREPPIRVGGDSYARTRRRYFFSVDFAARAAAFCARLPA